VVVDTVQDGVERFRDIVEVAQGQLAIVQLTVGEDAVDEFLHQSLQTRRRRIAQNAACGFHDVGQHDQTGLTGLRLGAGIAIIVDIDGIFAFELSGFVIEVLNQAGAMLLADGIGNAFAQLNMQTSTYKNKLVFNQW